MWVDDYFHYDDWEHKMKEVYDSFNLLVMPRPEGETKYYYDKENNMRITPSGIFPNPSGKRSMLLPNVVETFDPVTKNGADSINVFEKDKYKIMVNKELERSQKMGEVTNDLSFIVNLSNMKQGLKRDYSDKEIMDMLLKNLNFTDNLIEQHLEPKKQEQQDPTFAPRDANAYREFVKSTYFSKDQEDPFTHFYIKESGKIERVHKTFDEYQNKYTEFIKNADQEDISKKTKNILKTLGDKMDDMLLENQEMNQDTFSLTDNLQSEITIDYNLKSLMKTD